MSVVICSQLGLGRKLLKSPEGDCFVTHRDISDELRDRHGGATDAPASAKHLGVRNAARNFDARQVINERNSSFHNASLLSSPSRSMSPSNVATVKALTSVNTGFGA